MVTTADRLREGANGVRAQAQLFQNERADGDFRWDMIIRLMREKADSLDLLADAWEWIKDTDYGDPGVCVCGDCATTRSLLARIEKIA